MEINLKKSKTCPSGLYLLTVFMLLFCTNLFGQVQSFNDIPVEMLNRLNKMGIDNSSLLNEFESAYLNYIFKKEKGEIDFTGKRVAFIYSGANSCKKEYFDKERKRLRHHQTPNRGMLYILNETQKSESGGYDMVVLYWSKIAVPIDKVVKICKKNTSSRSVCFER